MDINLNNLEDTKKLGEALAKVLASLQCSQLVLLQGDLGAGKTTLVRFIAEALPGGEEAEVSSPSFTLCNIYPTSPELWHYDLYRLEDVSPSDDILDALEYFTLEGGSGEPVIMLVEWPERLETSLLPNFYIHCHLTADKNNRRASFKAQGKLAGKTLERLSALLGDKAGDVFE